MNVDGTDAQRLTSTGGVVAEPDFEAVDADPTWSPDGTQIAFESNREGSLQLWVMAADGSGQRRLTDQPDGATDAAWSPDGSEIAFTSDEDASTVHPDGSSPRLVTLSYPTLVVYLGGAPS